jgi:hypothetical protein
VKKKVKFLFFCMIFVAKIAFCQKNDLLNMAEMPNGTAFNQNMGYAALLRPVAKKTGLLSNLPAILGYKSRNFIKYLPEFKKINPSPIYYGPSLFSIIPANFYVQNFGFFCKKEVQLQKVTRLPFLFRLGSVQQCDWMEGKPNTEIRRY